MHRTGCCARSMSGAADHSPADGVDRGSRGLRLRRAAGPRAMHRRTRAFLRRRNRANGPWGGNQGVTHILTVGIRHVRRFLISTLKARVDRVRGAIRYRQSKTRQLHRQFPSGVARCALLFGSRYHGINPLGDEAPSCSHS
jgi:hypothetical protein